jgi:Fur family transcriptional regulator, ferric uptake regulator
LPPNAEALDSFGEKCVSELAFEEHMDNSDRYDHMAGLIRGKGLRMTLPRKIILNALADGEGYLSAEDLYLKVHPDQPGIGLATVYRTLLLLNSLGLVTKLEIGEGRARYELAETEHHHLIVCESCHKVVKYSDFTTQEKDSFAALERLVEKTYHFAINRHVVQYHGICPECLSEQGER